MVSENPLNGLCGYSDMTERLSVKPLMELRPQEAEKAGCLSLQGSTDTCGETQASRDKAQHLPQESGVEVFLDTLVLVWGRGGGDKLSLQMGWWV